MDNSAPHPGQWISYRSGPGGKDHLAPEVRARVEQEEALRAEARGRLLCEVSVLEYEREAISMVSGRVGLTMAQLKDTAQTGRRQDMRVMLMIKGDPEPGAAPSEELLAAMGRYNDELKEAGVLLDLSGLYPSAGGSVSGFPGGTTPSSTGRSPSRRSLSRATGSSK
jgi:hypothetical protein